MGLRHLVQRNRSDQNNPIIFGCDGASVHDEETWKERSWLRGEICITIASQTSAHTQPNDAAKGPNQQLKHHWPMAAYEVLKY